MGKLSYDGVVKEFSRPDNGMCRCGGVECDRDLLPTPSR
jgi:hypothetical protein